MEAAVQLGGVTLVERASFLDDLIDFFLNLT